MQAFPGPGEKHRISSKGGNNPVWSRKELFYLGRAAAGNMVSMMAVDVPTSSDFKAGSSYSLFDASSCAASTPLRSYDVTPDGQFIMTRQQRPPDPPVTRLNVVFGWADELKRRVR